MSNEIKKCCITSQTPPSRTFKVAQEKRTGDKGKLFVLFMPLFALFTLYV